MESCPNCNSKLKAVDTRGIFPFEGRASRVRWLIVFSFLIIIWSALILVLVPEKYQSIALLIYYPLSFAILIKLYKTKLNSIIYECVSCKNRFKGQKLTKFSYSDK
jgi:hypothetical protein